MSKENEKQRVTKFCVYCGTTIEENTAYCPNPKCGKLVINIKPSEDSFEKQISTPKLKKKGSNIANMFRMWVNNNFLTIRAMSYM